MNKLMFFVQAYRASDDNSTRSLPIAKNVVYDTEIVFLF